MSKPIRMSMQTRKNWLIDAAVFVGGLVAALSGIYFLYLPSGGYQGGAQPDCTGSTFSLAGTPGRTCTPGAAS